MGLFLKFYCFNLQFLHKPKNSKLYFLYFIPELSWKLLKYFESLVFFISLTCSQLLQIEKAVAFEISHSELLQAIKAFLLSILCIFPILINFSKAL